MKRYAYLLSMFTIILGFFIIGLFAFWFFYPYKVLSFNAGNGTFIENTVQSGDYLRMRQNSCKYMDLKSYIDRQFIDGIIYQVPTTIADRGLGCSNKIEYVYVPKALPQGEYNISTTIYFRPNPIRTIIYTVKTERFTVK